jgi:hypothetical protein
MPENDKKIIPISVIILMVLFDGVRVTTNSKVKHERNNNTF